MIKRTLKLLDYPQTLINKVALFIPKIHKDIMLPQISEQCPQLTKQNVEDFYQLLQIEGTNQPIALNSFRVRPDKSKRGFTKRIGAMIDNTSRNESTTDEYLNPGSKDSCSKPIRTRSKQILHTKNLSYNLLSQNNILKQNLKKNRGIAFSDKMSNEWLSLPGISNDYGITHRASFGSRNHKGMIKERTLNDLRLKKVSAQVFKKMKNFDRTLDNVAKEVQIEDFLENRRRKLIIHRHHSEQLKQTEMLLRDIILDQPKFINNLHEYRKECTVKFIEDRRNLKDRLYKMLADPNRVIGKLERQGLLRKDLALLRGKIKPIID